MTVCEHCGSPEKENWPQKCRYTEALRRDGWAEKEIQCWVRSGADAPCSFDAYDEQMDEIRRRELSVVLLTVGVILSIVVTVIIVASL